MADSGETAVQDASTTPLLMAVVVGIVTIVIVAMFMSYNGVNKETGAPESTSKGAPQFPSTSASKAKKKKKAKAAPAPAPAPEPVVEETPPEPTPASKKKKKKKKGDTAVAVAETPAPAPEPAPVPAPEPAPAPVSKSKKKKNKKGKVAAAPATAQSKPVPLTDDDDDDDSDDELEQAARLLGMAKKGKDTNNTLKTSASNKPATPVTNKAKAAKMEDLQQTPEVVLDIGSDPAVLIGPGGSTIQRITAESGARLDVLKNAPIFGQNRVRITTRDGGSEDPNSTIARAVELVQALLDEQAAIAANSKTITLSSSDINGQAGVKAIIGRGGETIQSILQSCNSEANGQLVKINASVEAGTVEISGPKSLVDKAAKLCKQAVFGETQATVKLTSRSAMNIVFGKDFKTIRQLQDTTGAKLDMDKDTLTLQLSGKREQVDAARSAVSSLLSRCKGIAMDIKAADVGAIYGKGGATIRTIQDKTGAFIEVEQASSTNADGEATVKCSIMGEPDACALARELIGKALAREVELKPGEIAETLNLGGASTAAVIGRGGSKIKELETAHKVSLNVNGDVCRIVGKKPNVEAAKTAIETIIKPILEAEEAQKQATIAAEAGDSAWQGYDVPADEDGW
jgi:rRNA processing protein Krr1/Pno1